MGSKVILVRCFMAILFDLGNLKKQVVGFGDQAGILSGALAKQLLLIIGTKTGTKKGAALVIQVKRGRL